MLAIGTLVPNTGNLTNGLFQSGQGIEKTTYTFPMLNVGPRFGVAYDVTGKQQFVLRGAWGLYFDRPRPGDAQALVGNPPGGSRIITIRYGQLQSLTSGGLSTVSPPGITVFQYDAKLPTSMQFSVGAQMLLPWSTSLDVSYVGLHSWNDQQPWNINSIDLGTAFLASSQDVTLAGQHHARRHLVCRHQSRSRARVSRLQLDGEHEPVLRRLADLPLAAVLAEPPVQGRTAVRVQRHGSALRRSPRRAAIRSQG